MGQSRGSAPKLHFMGHRICYREKKESIGGDYGRGARLTNTLPSSGASIACRMSVFGFQFPVQRGVLQHRGMSFYSHFTCAPLLLPMYRVHQTTSSDISLRAKHDPSQRPRLPCQDGRSEASSLIHRQGTTIVRVKS